MPVPVNLVSIFLEKRDDSAYISPSSGKTTFRRSETFVSNFLRVWWGCGNAEALSFLQTPISMVQPHRAPRISSRTSVEWLTEPAVTVYCVEMICVMACCL